MRAWLALLFAAGPGAYLLLRGRTLLARRDDPALPERFFAYRRQVGTAVAFGLALLLTLAWDQAAWAMPLLLLGAAAGGFPVRRALFEESWGLVSYLAHVIRFTAATSGLWIAVALVPGPIAAAGPQWTLAAGATLAVLLAWSLTYNSIFVRLLGARALSRGDLDERLAAVESRARVAPPRRMEAGPAGGRWANAFALPSTKRGSVVFGRTLLERLEPDEIAAVHAHELAHLEHFDTARLRRHFAVTLTAILLACGPLPLAVQNAGGWRVVLLWGWPIAIVLGLGVYMSRHKAHEGESDARAVALLDGDGEALIRALSRIHALSALPARWAADFEAQASHPSLAARAQLIRAAGGAPPPRLTEPFRVPGIRDGDEVVLEPERLQLRLAGRERTLAYGELAELRVNAGVTGVTHLVVRLKAGRALKLPIRTEDVPAVQAALDRLGLLPAAADQGATAPPLVSTFLLFAVLVVSMAIGPEVAMAPLLAAGLALVHRAAPGLAAVAVTAAGTALLASAPRVGPAMSPDVWTLARWVLLLVGAVAAVLAVRTAQRGRGPARWAWVVPAGLAASSAVLYAVWLAAAWLEPAVLRLHQAALARPSAALLPLGLAAALLASPSRRLRAAALLPALLAALPLLARSERFGMQYGRDPLHSAAPLFTERSLAGAPWREIQLDRPAVRARVSPSGALYAWQTPSTDREPNPAFRLARVADGSAAGPEMAADDLQFLDDSRVLAVVSHDDGGMELQIVEAATGQIAWQRALPALSAPRVGVDASTGRWRVAGWAGEPLASVVLEGAVGGGDPEERRTRLELSTSAMPMVVQTARSALGVQPILALGDGLLVRLAGVPTSVYGSELWDLGAAAPRRLLGSALRVECADPAPGEARFLCTADDGVVTHLWALEPPSWQPAPLGRVPGRLARPQVAGEWVVATDGSGWWLANLSTHAVDRLEGPPGTVALESSLRGDLLATLTFDRRRSTLRLYRLTR
jgi:Zn-dependent protease with chaperone function